MSEENKAVVRRFAEEVMTNKNLAAADEIVAEDYVELDPMPGQEQGREGFKRFLGTTLFAAFPDLQWTIEMIAEEDKVVGRATYSGTHRGEFMGIPPTYRTVAASAWVIDRIVDGKMQESRLLIDAADMLQQLGVFPPHPGVVFRILVHQAKKLRSRVRTKS
jgi:steroid delta-isomerase-like uncharacterized protein